MSEVISLNAQQHSMRVQQCGTQVQHRIFYDKYMIAYIYQFISFPHEMTTGRLVNHLWKRVMEEMCVMTTDMSTNIRLYIGGGKIERFLCRSSRHTFISSVFKRFSKVIVILLDVIPRMHMALDVNCITHLTFHHNCVQDSVTHDLSFLKNLQSVLMYDVINFSHPTIKELKCIFVSPNHIDTVIVPETIDTLHILGLVMATAAEKLWKRKIKHLFIDGTSLWHLRSGATFPSSLETISVNGGSEDLMIEITKILPDTIKEIYFSISPNKYYGWVFDFSRFKSLMKITMYNKCKNVIAIRVIFPEKVPSTFTTNCTLEDETMFC